MATKSERVVQEGIDPHGSRGVRNIIQITLRIRILQINGRWSDLRFQRLAAQERFDASRRAEHVSGRPFGGTNCQLPGVVTEDPLNGLGFANIPNRGAGGVSVDVIDLFRTHPGVLEPHLDSPRRASTLGIGRGHVVGIAGVAIAHDLTIDACPALLGMFQLLEHQNRGPLPHHESISVAIEGSAGVLRIFIAGGHGLHSRKPTHA